MVESFKLSRICQWSGEISGIKGLPGGKENPILGIAFEKALSTAPLYSSPYIAKTPSLHKKRKGFSVFNSESG